ncbi:MAG: hypothetical protein IH892_13670 [Planctomycetes bacterium]|nr:hypothetical protein [Planctomycetota bacterium]
MNGWFPKGQVQCLGLAVRPGVSVIDAEGDVSIRRLMTESSARIQQIIDHAQAQFLRVYIASSMVLKSKPWRKAMLPILELMAFEPLNETRQCTHRSTI